MAVAIDNARIIDALRMRNQRDVARKQRREFGFDRTAHAENLKYHLATSSATSEDRWARSTAASNGSPAARTTPC